MISHYLFLVVTGALGVFLLLGLQVFTRWHNFRRYVTATWLTLLTLVWLTLPQECRWLLSLWSPATMLDGRLLLEMTPAIWLLGAVLGATFSGVAWVRIADERRLLPLSGMLTISMLLISWLALLSASLLMTLIAWSTFDLLWGVAALIAGSDDERVTFGWAIHGFASLLLWIVSLLLAREGCSTLWWLMQPSEPLLSLLLIAAVLRVGIYPWHLVFPQRAEKVGLLVVAVALGPLLGFGLWYRVLSLPLVVHCPAWMTTLGVITLLWGALRAWDASSEARRPLLWAAYALLGAVVVGTALTGSAVWLLRALATWWAGWVLLLLSRGREGWLLPWSWPGLLAVLLLLGVPPSPLGVLYRAALGTANWAARFCLLTGLALTGATFLREIARSAEGRVTPPWPWQQVTLGVGLLLLLGGLM
ncbi:MAG: hypothetical protein K8R89_05195, partial [Anaerolineae bacterium]|nr:hypothetical protein [Anaerolineae bacterium]